MALNIERRLILEELVRRGIKLPDDFTMPELTFNKWLKEVSPELEWDWRYLLYVQDKLNKVTSGEIKRLMIFMPPRLGKSTCATVRFPVYRIEKDPNCRVIIAAYSADLANKFSRQARKIALNRFELAQDSKSVSNWEVKNGVGGIRAVGIGGGVTGMGANLIVLDDVIKSREEADSIVYRDKIWDAYTDDIYSRLEPNGAIIIVNTRWHEDDLCGRILASGDGPNWTVVSLPALAEYNDPLGREYGEALCPERYTKEDYEAIQLVQTKNFVSLYQQRPTAEKGDIFKAEWFTHTYKNIPEFKSIWTTWDTAMTKDERNDESVCCTMGEGIDNNLYLLGVKFGRWETPELGDLLVTNARKLKSRYQDKYKGDYIENKANGGPLIQYLKRSSPDVMLIPMNVKGDKVLKANAITPILESGRLLVPDLTIYTASRSWFEGLMTQALSFPNAAHDDRVDAFTLSILRWMGQYTVTRASNNRPRRSGYV